MAAQRDIIRTSRKNGDNRKLGMERNVEQNVAIRLSLALHARFCKLI